MLYDRGQSELQAGRETGRSRIWSVVGLLCTSCSVQLWGSPCDSDLSPFPGTTETISQTPPTDTGSKPTTPTTTTTTEPEDCTSEEIEPIDTCDGALHRTISDNWLEVSVGAEHTCGLDSSSLPICWGNGDLGQTDTSAFKAGYEFFNISAGSNHTCGYAIEGANHWLKCWGDNASDQLGKGYISAKEFTGTEVSAGKAHTCYRNQDELVSCMGADVHGLTSPPEKSLFDLSVGVDIACGLTADNAIWCWGADTDPWQVAGTYSQVSVGSEHTCALQEADGALRCWCNTDFSTEEELDEELLTETFLQIDIGNGFGCGVTQSSALVCWGRNDEACQLSDVPTSIQASAVSVSLTGNHACALEESPPNHVVCWGADDSGQASSF